MKKKGDECKGFVTKIYWTLICLHIAVKEWPISRTAQQQKAYMKKKGDECKGFVTKRSTGLLFVCILQSKNGLSVEQHSSRKLT